MTSYPHNTTLYQDPPTDILHPLFSQTALLTLCTSNMDNTAIWKKTLAQIEIKLDSPAQFKTWFKDTRLIKIDDKCAVIGVKNSYTADWLYKRHLKVIKETLSFICGGPIQPQFIYDKIQPQRPVSKPQISHPILQVKEGIDEDTQNRISTARLNERYSFTSYVVGESNRLAYAASWAVAQKPGKAYNPLFLYGPTGIGKTHLIQAIGRFIIDSHPHKRVSYTTTENFLNDMVQSIQSGKMREFREKYRKVDVLLVDDIQQISNAKETQNEFFNTFNVLFHDSKQIVITSDRMPDQIPNIEDRLISRFKGGMVADIAKPLYEERVAILKRKISDIGISLPEHTIRYIAEIIKDSIRALEGALQKVSLYSSMKKGGELSNAEIAKILGLDPNSKRRQIKLPTILKKVAQEFQIKAQDLRGPRRTKDIAFARQVSMYILRVEFGYKLQEISELLKRNDHTTALHAIDKIQSMMASNMTFKEQIDNLIEDIQRPLDD